jgi:polysaccharide export outer membrane protein
MTFAKTWPLLLAILLAGCAGMSTDYDTPAQAGQIPFDVSPITAGLVNGMRVERPSAAEPPSGTTAPDAYAYRIGPADILSIYVNQPLFDDGTGDRNRAAAPGEASQESLYVVNDQGTIFLPLHGPLKVAGLTVAEAYDRIREALARFITEPQINVRVAEYRSQRVVVAGASGGGYLPITDQPMTIVDAILQGTEDASGPEEPDLRSVVLKRDGRDISVDVEALMASGDFGREWVLQDGDVVVVPENRNAVYLAGEGPNLRVTVDPFETTLAEVLLRNQQGGGNNQGSTFLRSGATRLGSIFVIRGDTSFADVYHLNARTPDALILAEQFPMQHGDIVFVSTNPVTRFNRFVSETLPSLAPLLLAEQFTN